MSNESEEQSLYIELVLNMVSLHVFPKAHFTHGNAVFHVSH